MNFKVATSLWVFFWLMLKDSTFRKKSWGHAAGLNVFISCHQKKSSSYQKSSLKKWNVAIITWIHLNNFGCMNQIGDQTEKVRCLFWRSSRTRNGFRSFRSTAFSFQEQRVISLLSWIKERVYWTNFWFRAK